MSTDHAPSLPPLIILCGGLGTRLRPAVKDMPKVLAPVGNTPFLGRLLEHLKNQGARDIILSTGYGAEQVREYAEDGDQWSIRIRYAREPEPLGTAGALRFAAGEAGLRDAFLAINGDTFFSGQLKRLVDFHRDHKAKAAVALVRVENARRYGTVRFDAESGVIEAFLEKSAASGSAWINAGAYVLEPSILKSVPTDSATSLEKDVFPHLVAEELFGCTFPDATFLDIGTPEDYARAEEVIQSD